MIGKQSRMPEFMEMLAKRRRFGMRQGLEVIRELLARMGNPEKELVAVHIAGTNGKGSVAAIIDAVLRSAGLPVGKYTSPHLLYFNERICCNGRMVSDDELSKALTEVEAAAVEIEAAGHDAPTFFECATAAAFKIFRQNQIKLAVIETGLGGRLDATNVVMPLVSVITRIGLDHTQWLGETVEEIAKEKGGIIKPGRPVVLGAMPDEARVVLEEIANRQGSPLVISEKMVTINAVKFSLEGLTVHISTNARDFGKIKSGLVGTHQYENIATAMAALAQIEEELGYTLPDSAYKSGLSEVVWPGRFQIVSKAPPVIVDGAHNPDGARALSQTLKQARFRGPIGMVAGFCEDKDYDTFLQIMKGIVSKAWAITVLSPRALAGEQVRNHMIAAGIDATIAADSSLSGTVAEALAWAEKEQGAIIVCGSLFLVGAALAHFNAFPWQVDNERERDPAEQLKK